MCDELGIGLHQLVWSVIITHIPEDKLQRMVDQSIMTIDQYIRVIESVLRDPATSKELHTFIMDSLKKIDELLTKNGIPQQIAQ